MKSRKGSALLVVLGMLSFMVISGLAFAVYMRTTRLSSSFTRRTVTTRQLAKAALAEAIDQIDRAVANDPHPGVRNPYRQYSSMLSSGNSSSSSSSSGNPSAEDFDPAKIDNVWSHRVLIGQAGSLNELDSGVEVQVGAQTYYPAFVDPEDTTPVLSLEALAYLPPSLVNEVRYYGQRTPTAAWQTLDYDAGRFAYIAVDVSDFFDVNRICANLARSSDPLSRVTLGHIFETDLLHENSGSNASDWDQFLGLRRTVGSDGDLTFNSQLPFVSLADFALGLGTRVKAGGLQSPFYEYCNQKSSSGMGFYVYGENSDEYERYSLMNFVTDSLMAERPKRELITDADEKILNLADDNNQIFRESFLHTGQENRKLIDIGAMKGVDPFSRLVQKRVPYVTMFALNDYLDSDRIPITLGMPSVERVPMICGIKTDGINGTFAIKLVFDRDNGGQTKYVEDATKLSRHCTRTVAWHLDENALSDGFTLGIVRALVVYPFRNHEQQDESSWFKLDGKVQVFLSTEQMRLRTGNASDSLHWGALGDDASGAKDGVKDNAVFNIPLNEQQISLNTFSIANQSVNNLGQCATEVRFELGAMSKKPADIIKPALQGALGDLLNVTYEWDETRNTTDDPWQTSDGSSTPAQGSLPGSYAKKTKSSSSFYALKSDGSVDPDLSGIKDNISGGFKKTLTLNMALTLRVISDNTGVKGAGSGGKKTVDMVPATIYNDELNNINNGSGLGAAAYQSLCGAPTPLMKFEMGKTIDLELKDPGSGEAFTPSPKAVMVNDPRYNHAPENWVEMSSFSASDWYAIARASAAANDGDIFMASSDQEYMQSVYEFAFLPRMSDLVQYGDAIRGNLAAYPTDAASSWTQLAPNGTDVTKALDAGVMWRTYDIFGRYSSDGDDFEGLGLEYEGKGLRVNPYSNLDSVLMAAFANTPHDWRAASNNEDTNPAGSSGMDDAKTFNQKHSWNQYSSGAKLSWAKLETIVGQFYDRMRDGFSHPNNVTYSEDKNYAISGVDDEYAPIWQDVFDSFFGNATGTDAEQWLCNVKLDDGDCSSVYSVDKKFLYGYWKSCFAARQQLYLVFFRAEPMMLGGGVAGVTPPQLGAKGVAVVWRDPYDPNERKNSSGTVTRHYPNSSSLSSGNNTYIPHGTRVLFYKQFE